MILVSEILIQENPSNPKFQEIQQDIKKVGSLKTYAKRKYIIYLALTTTEDSSERKQKKARQ